MKRILIFLLISFNSYSFPGINDPEVPSSVHDLLEVKDKKSTQYEIASYNAAVDLYNLGKSFLKTGNSVKALKYLHLGATLFPYRGDLNSLKRTALVDFVTITNKMIQSPDIGCDMLVDRVSLLKRISPDEFLKLKGFAKKCKVPKVKSIGAQLKYNPLDYLNSAIPAVDSRFEKTYSEEDLSKQAESVIFAKENTYYPKYEVLINGMKFLNNFSFISKNISVDQSKTTRGNLWVTTQYYVDWQNDNYPWDRFCENLYQLFKDIPTASNSYTSCKPTTNMKSFYGTRYYSVKVSKVNTSQVYQSSSGPFNWNGLPEFLIADVFYIIKGQKKQKGQLVMNFNEMAEEFFSFSRNIEGAKKDFHFSSSYGPDLKTRRKDFQFRSHYTMNLKVSKKELEGLERVIVQFNPNKTYQTYKKIFDSWKGYSAKQVKGFERQFFSKI